MVLLVPGYGDDVVGGAVAERFDHRISHYRIVPDRVSGMSRTRIQTALLGRALD